MKFKLCALLSAVTFAVTACGGSGDDNTVQVNQPTKPVATDNDQPFTMKEQIMVWKGADKNNGQYDLEGKVTINNSPTMSVGQDSNDKTSLTKITINGVDIPFEPESTDTVFNYGGNVAVPYSSTIAYASTVAYGANTAYARFGALNFMNTKNKNHSGDYILFYQGNPTSLDDMKKLEKNANNVTYNGAALALEQGTFPYHAKAEVYHPSLSGLSRGTAQFTVNFKDKTLKGIAGQWDNKTLKPVNIDAQIRANTFAGTANKTGTVEGKFYGPNAAELAGSFNDKSQKLRGVFGAVKQ